MKTNIFNRLNGKDLKIAVIQARFNQNITDNLTKGAIKALKKTGILEQDIKIIKVPGSFEIPLACQKIAKEKVFDGIITIGAVIKGETAHFDYISQATTNGIMQVILHQNIPITFGIITTYNLDQAKARALNDETNKGYESAMALVEVICNL